MKNPEQIEEILIGWKNLVFKSPKHEEIAKRRLMICDGCDAFKLSKRCGECGCYIPAKARNLKSKCPLGKWTR